MRRRYRRVGLTAAQSAELWERWKKGHARAKTVATAADTAAQVSEGVDGARCANEDRCRNVGGADGPGVGRIGAH
jgi:hypothetical protein